MKTFITIALGLTFAGAGIGQVTNTFESGNRAIDKNNCWQYNSMNINASGAIEGGYSCQSGALTAGSHSLISPWVYFHKKGVLRFSHRMSADNGTTRILTVYLLDQLDNMVKVLYYHEYPGDRSKLIYTDIDMDVSGSYRIKWVFNGTGGSSRGTLDQISIPGTYHSDPTTNNGFGNCTSIASVSDLDKDGVVDLEDAYPEDSYRAFNNFYPAKDWGSLGFEDLWPSKGDFDFNDLVVDYQFNIVTDARNEIVEIKGRFSTRAIGASFHNALGFSLMKVPSASVIRIKNSFEFANSRNYFVFANNGVETEQTWATIIVYEDAFKVLPHPGSGPGVNTSIGAPYVEPGIVEVLVTLKEDGVAAGDPINFLDWDQDNFNFFMVVKVDEGRGIEVHLPDQMPTDLADRSLFGTRDDASRLDSKYTYRSRNNLPWAINLLTPFAYPIEKSDVINTYLKFGFWAETGGQQYRDWYMDRNGYTNHNLKYKR